MYYSFSLPFSLPLSLYFSESWLLIALMLEKNPTEFMASLSVCDSGVVAPEDVVWVGDCLLNRSCWGREKSWISCSWQTRMLACTIILISLPEGICGAILRNRTAASTRLTANEKEREAGRGRERGGPGPAVTSISTFHQLLFALMPNLSPWLGSSPAGYHFSAGFHRRLWVAHDQGGRLWDGCRTWPL